MSLPQALLLAAVLVGLIALWRGIGATLREFEPAGAAPLLRLPLLHTALQLIAHYAGRWLRLSWRAAQCARLRAAGFAGRPTPPEWFALRCLGALLGAAGGAAAVLLPVRPHGPGIGSSTVLLATSVPSCALLLGAVLPELWLRARIRRRQRRIESDLGLYLEMVLAALEAGVEWPAALRSAVQSGPAGAVQRAFAHLQAERHTAGEAGAGLARIALLLQAPGAQCLLGDARRALANGEGLRRALYGAIVREEGRRLVQAEQSACWSARRLAAPLLTGVLPGLLLLVLFARPP